MSFISQPAANLHSPGAIGDVSRGSGAFEPLNAFGQAVFWDGLDVKFTNTLNIQSGTMYLNSSGIGMNASKILTWGPDAGVISSNPDIGLARPAIGVLKVTNGSSGTGKLITGTFNIAAIQTSASGLSSGDIWSNLGILTIVA